jgi:hypothetical protein
MIAYTVRYLIRNARPERAAVCHGPFCLRDVTCLHTKPTALLSDGNCRVDPHPNSVNTGKDTRPDYQVGSVGNAADL